MLILPPNSLLGRKHMTGVQHRYSRYTIQGDLNQIDAAENYAWRHRMQSEDILRQYQTQARGAGKTSADIFAESDMKSVLEFLEKYGK